MNYVFDVCLNFNKELINFYEWDNNDEILYFLKTPVFKIEEELMEDFIKHDIKVDSLFLKKIYNKSQIYFNKNNKSENYFCILTTDKKSVGLNINKNGYVIGKSYLSLEEETEVEILPETNQKVIIIVLSLSALVLIIMIGIILFRRKK